MLLRLTSAGKNLDVYLKLRSWLYDTVGSFSRDIPLRHVTCRACFTLREVFANDFRSEFLRYTSEYLVIYYAAHKLLRWVVPCLVKESHNVAVARQVEGVIVGSECL